METRKEKPSEPKRRELSFEQTLAILAKVPKAEVDALEVERTKRPRGAAKPERKQRKKTGG